MLGEIKKIKVRKCWKYEDVNFTKWLAKAKNLALLSGAIGIDIKLIKIEASAGKFRVDILAEDNITKNKIIIENQLEITDHSHLGKAITYASYLDASIIIWIVTNAHEEHRQAIDWLNNMNNDISFFLIKLELLQINNSPWAPYFQIISRPNNWSKSIKEISTGPTSKKLANEIMTFLKENNVSDFTSGILYSKFNKDNKNNLLGGLKILQEKCEIECIKKGYWKVNNKSL